MKFLRALLLSLIFSSYGARAQETPENVTFASDWIDYTVSLIRQRTDEDPELNIAYQVSVDNQTGVPGAWVDVRSSTISLSASQFMLYVYFSDITMAQLVSGRDFSECFDDYWQYVGLQQERIAEANLEGRVDRFLPPELFGRIGNGCSGLDEVLPLEERFRSVRNDRVVNAVGFTILHEIGHLAERHEIDAFPILRGEEIGSRRSLGAAMQYYCNSRREESEADRFAVRKIVEYGWAPSLIQTPLWNTLLATNGFAASEDRLVLFNHSSHPFPTARAAEALTYAVELLVASGQPVQPDVEQRINNIARLQGEFNSKLDDILSELPFDIPAMGSCR